MIDCECLRTAIHLITMTMTIIIIIMVLLLVAVVLVMVVMLGEPSWFAEILHAQHTQISQHTTYNA